MGEVRRFPVQQAVTRVRRFPMNNEPKLKEGYIFIPLVGDVLSAQVPREYIVSRMGDFGYYGKLDADHINGFEPIPVLQYHPDRP